MARTNRQVVESTRELIADRTGKIADGNQWSRRLILYYLRLFRSRIIFEKRHQRHEQDHRFNRQTIPCITLSEVDKAESPGVPPSGCIWLKSEHTLPRPIMGLLDSVNSIIGNLTYDYVPWEHYQFRIDSRIQAQRFMPYYTLKNVKSGVHIYLLNDTSKERIAVTAVFENPLEAQFYPGCGLDVDKCSPLEQEFIVDEELLPIIMQQTAEKILALNSNSYPDITTDSIDDTAVPRQQRNE